MHALLLLVDNRGADQVAVGASRRHRRRAETASDRAVQAVSLGAIDDDELTMQLANGYDSVG